MKRLIRIALLALGLAAFFGTAEKSEAQLDIFLHVANGPYGVGGVNGAFYFSGPFVSEAYGFVTDGNGNAAVSFGGQWALFYYITAGNFSVQIGGIPNGLSLDQYGYSGSVNVFGSESIDLQFNVTTGPLIGSVTSGNIGVNNVTVNGNGTHVTTDANGNYNLGTGGAQTISISKTGCVVSAPATIYPGRPQLFNIYDGPITGTVSGTGNQSVDIKTSGYYSCDNFTDSSGNFTTCSEYYSQTCTVTPVKAGYHFVPASYTGVPPGESGLSFTAISTPPKIASLTDYVFSENQGTFTNNISGRFTYGDVTPGNVQLTAVSSNASLIPNTPQSIQIVGSAPNQSLILTPVPGATGATAITVVLNDGINPVTNKFNVTINKTAQRPVVGMPVALNFNGANDYIRVTNWGNVAPTSEVTVEFWQNVQTVNQTQATIVMNHDNGNNRFNIHSPWPDGVFGTVYWDFGSINGTGRIFYQLPASIAGKWTHFAFVSSKTANNGSGMMQIYENGVLVASKASSDVFAHYSDDLIIGGNSYHGSLSDVRIWNVALSASNILQTMNNPLVGNEPGLVAYYRLNENSGVTVHDSSHSGYHGSFLQSDYPYPAWVNTQSNYSNYVVASFSLSNKMYLPAYVQDYPVTGYPITNYVWSLVTSNNLHGTLTPISGGQWNYVPDPNFSGGDASFVYSVSTGTGTFISTSTVNIRVTPLNPPILSAIPNQLILENTTSTIFFTVTDTNTPVDSLIYSAVSDNPNLIVGAGLPTPQIVTNNGNTNATLALNITPAPDSIGSANITVSVNDGHNTVFTNFVLQVNQQPAYTIIDLGVLSSRFASYGTAINNEGQVVGYCTDGSRNQNQKQGFIYSGFAAGGLTLALSSNFSLACAAYGINDSGQVTGTMQTSGGSFTGFFYDYINAKSLVSIGTLGGSTATGYGINNNTAIAGSGTIVAGQTHAFFATGASHDLNLPGGTNAAFAINDAGQMVGYIVTNGVTNAFFVTPVATNGFPASTNFLGFVPGGTNSIAYAINQLGDVVGSSGLTNGFPHAWLKSGSGGLSDLGTPNNMLGATAYGLNSFDQVVGTAVAANGATHAFLYSTGRMNDLNDLIPYEETNTWNLIDAHGINDSGAIVGTGIIGGQTHAFLALPAWVAGQPIARPLGTVAEPPATTVISGPTTSASPFYWDPHTLQLFAIVPCTAEIQWPTSTLNVANPTNTTPPVISVSKTVWPRVAQTHVAGSPVQVMPQGIPSNVQFPYSFQSVLYSTSLNAGVDQSGVFNTPTNCYSVLRYISVQPGQQPPYPIDAPSIFQVIRSVNWNDPYYLLSNNVPALIGAPITNPTHFDYAGRNGYVYFQKTPYDGLASDPDRAYDVATRTGPIIPVNKINTTLAVPDKPLVVVWYHTNAIGVPWADSPYNYVPYWQTNTDPTNTIVIASLLGSGPLPPTYVLPNPYVQNDPTQTGFNPNEEHALTAAGTLYALRNDLNSLYGNLSQPFTLLKYQDAANNNQWTMRVFSVITTNATYPFQYSGTAGTQIQPPLPLSLMQLCSSSNTGTAGPYYHAQVDGSLWARAAGPNGATTNIIMHYWYPLQPDFYYASNTLVGSCIPWLDYGTKTPVDITYVISWPHQYVMPVGQTLTTPINGLPDIKDLLNANIIYDSLNIAGLSTTTNLARLYDPYSARTVPVPASATWPTSLKLNNVNGIDQFGDLPYYLRLRLIYDPINYTLSFQGVDAVSGTLSSPGPTILLNNVMSIREREEIKSLDGGKDTTDFDHLIDQLYDLTRNPNQLTLNPPAVNTNNPDKALLIGLTAQTNVTYTTNGNTVTSNSSVVIVPEKFGGQPKALTTGLFGTPPPQADPPGSTNYPPEYITIVQDDPTTPGSVVQMYVIQVSGGPSLGSLAVLPGDNAFDQRLTLRHTDDFGGDPDPFTFEWYYFHGDNGGVAPPPPIIDSTGRVVDDNGWLFYSAANVSTDTNGLGANDITLGEGGESGLLVMSDNWFISRYKGYNIDGATNWSDWIGQPGGGAQFAEGWISRVLQGLNPFDARSSDFHTDPINTYQTMLEQAGPPYQGPIALNADPNYINSIGLIEAYQTVLQIGESLSVNGTPPVQDGGANQALQLAAGKISALEVVLANEAYAEFSDPTIGFNLGSSYTSISSSIFAFQDQVATLLDQELDLLRGRDDTGTTVKTPPVFNRLYWNFTGGNGEVGYVSTFDITDVNLDGFINTADAAIMFPQGHGDAWGYYLSALKVYYDLLQNTNFVWTSGAGALSVAGVPVQVNFADEQAFAHAAAGKAQTGSDIVRKTYESAYVEDPNGQYQGYEDTDTNRAWGLSEWSRRAGQGAYFDWVTVNALLPAVDPNTNHTGLNLVDRTTVTDISTIPPAFAILQNQLDQADAGLNPLGLVKQSVPFDIDPTQIDQGVTHFEQIYNRAISAMANAEAVWTQANQFTSALRAQQDSVQQFSQNVASQDQDYQSRLIEVFGYPYAGDIGQPGAAYPQGYSGPDLYHYMYVDTSSYDSAVSPPTSTVVGTYTPMSGPNTTFFVADVPTSYPLTSNNLSVNFPIGNPRNLFQPPAAWGSRRAPGEIQNTLNTMMQDQIRLQEAVDNYSALLTQIQNNLLLLQAHYNLNTSNSTVQNNATESEQALNGTALALTVVASGLKGVAKAIEKGSEIALASVPGVEGLADDALAPLRGTIKAVQNTTQSVVEAAAAVATAGATGMQAASAYVQSQANITIAANTLGYTMQAQVTDLQNQIQQEPALRLECFSQRETVIQDLGAYQAALAKGQQILQQRCTFAQQAAAQTSAARYQDMTFRIFQNDAIQKYEAQFQLAKQYVYRAAIAYDYETDLLGTSTGGGQSFLTSIIQQQSLGEMNGNTPVVGVPGLADPLAQMGQDFAVLKGQLGFNNPQTETGKFSLRYSLFRQQTSVTNVLPINGTFTNDWPTELQNHIVPDLWQIPEFVRYCKPFAPQSAGPQPGLVISFGSTITYGLNFFGWPLAGGDSAYDPTLFTTKVRSLGVWFDGYDNAGLSTTPRVYLVPVGNDMMRSPTDGFTVRSWRVQDQAIPVPFPLGASTEKSPSYIPMNSSLSGSLNQIRRFSSFLGYTDQGSTINPLEVVTDSRQVGRSVWNSQWMLIIPGGTLLNDPNAGLQNFIHSVSDIKIYFQTYSYSGD